MLQHQIDIIQTKINFLIFTKEVFFKIIDLIFEDIALSNIFYGEVNQVRLYISLIKRYGENYYDLLYWDASDRRSLDVFQTAYQDNIHFL